MSPRVEGARARRRVRPRWGGPPGDLGTRGRGRSRRAENGWTRLDAIEDD